MPCPYLAPIVFHLNSVASVGTWSMDELMLKDVIRKDGNSQIKNETGLDPVPSYLVSDGNENWY